MQKSPSLLVIPELGIGMRDDLACDSMINYVNKVSNGNM